MLDNLVFAKSVEKDHESKFSNAVMNELQSSAQQTKGNDDAQIDLVDYRVSKEHARNLCNGLNQAQNQMCMEAWRKDGYRTKSEIDTHETIGEAGARQEKEMQAYERKNHYRPLDRYAPWNRDPSRLNGDGSVRCLGPDAPRSKGADRFRCGNENSAYW